MINKEFILFKIKDLEEPPKGVLFFKNGNIYFDCMNLTWLSKDILQDYGISADIASKFNKYYGCIGEEAETASKKSVSLSSRDIQDIFKVSVRISTQEVSGCIGNSIFKNLPDHVQAVLVSLWRQFGKLSGFESPALAMAAKMLVRGHIESAIRYLQDERGWSIDHRKFMDRRLKEAAVLETLIRKGK